MKIEVERMAIGWKASLMQGVTAVVSGWGETEEEANQNLAVKIGRFAEESLELADSIQVEQIKRLCE